MRTCDISACVGASTAYAYVLRDRDQLPFIDTGKDIAPSAAFLVAVQRELVTFGATVDEARDYVMEITNEMRALWGDIYWEKSPLWLVITYDRPKLVSSADALRMLGVAMRNGSKQSWPVNLNRVFQNFVSALQIVALGCRRSRMRGMVVMDRYEAVERLSNPGRDIVAALAHHFDPQTGEANWWSRCSLYEMAKALHKAAGHNPDGMRRDDVLTWRADGGRQARFITNETTTDFPNAIGQAILRTATQRFQLAGGALRTIAVRRDRTNMNPGFSARMVPPELLELGEAEEIQTGNVWSRAETIQVKTYARSVSLSRQSLVTDALNLIGDAVRGLVDAAAQIEEDLLFAVFSANSYAGLTMSDGNALFHATHGNTSTGAISSTSLAAGFEAMANQTDANGTLFLDNSPRYLVCGPKNPEDRLRQSDPGAGRATSCRPD